MSRILFRFRALATAVMCLLGGAGCNVVVAPEGTHVAGPVADTSFPGDDKPFNGFCGRVATVGASIHVVPSGIPAADPVVPVNGARSEGRLLCEQGMEGGVHVIRVRPAPG